MPEIPEVINNYNVYAGNSNKLIGVSGEISLAEIASVTATISGAGLLGEIAVPVTGQFSSSEQEIPFNNLYSSIFDLFKIGKPCNIVLRGSMQVIDSSTGEIVYLPVKITYKGYAKKITPGKMKAANTMDSALTLEVTYLHIEIDNKSKIKIDKLNSVFTVNGVDQISEISKQC